MVSACTATTPKAVIPGIIVTGRPISVERPIASSMASSPGMRRIYSDAPERAIAILTSTVVAITAIKIAANQLSAAC
ncbi:MAG: hypothetical protein KatS3mg021_1442 [Fimbriimonadales bacterium]|nr:MAG: hypothetical protein KatS3mg021_1442 [Fimbriimonadales bacterium]